MHAPCLRRAPTLKPQKSEKALLEALSFEPIIVRFTDRVYSLGNPTWIFEERQAIQVSTVFG
jgi:hypothetical protein